MKTLLFIPLLCIPLVSSAQKWVTKHNDDTMGTTMYPAPQQIITTDSTGARHSFKIAIEDPKCSRCRRTAAIWSKDSWYCTKHYKKLHE